MGLFYMYSDNVLICKFYVKNGINTIYFNLTLFRQFDIQITNKCTYKYIIINLSI